MLRNVKVTVKYTLNPDSEDSDLEDYDMTSEDLEEIFECLRYKDVMLILLPNSDGDWDIFAMEVNLRFTTGHKRNYKR